MRLLILSLEAATTTVMFILLLLCLFCYCYVYSATVVRYLCVSMPPAVRPSPIERWITSVQSGPMTD